MTDTNQTPTLTESELLETLEDIKRTQEAPCRLCSECIDVSDAKDWGEVFEALAEHGEEYHQWDNRTGWYTSD